MNNLTQRMICVPTRLNPVLAIVVLAVAAATSGCSVVEQFGSTGACPCSCGEDTCGENVPSCCAAASPGLNASSQITYPQSLPAANLAPGMQTPVDPWVNRAPVQRPAGYQSSEAQVREVREEFDKTLASLEARFDEEHRANSEIRGQVQTLNGTVEQLSDDVEYWKDQVHRFARTSEEYHRSDMANMRSISELIDEIAPGSADSSSGKIPDTQTE